MAQWFDYVSSLNVVSVIMVCLVLASLYQGAKRGASGSARHLFFFIIEAVFTVVSVLLAWKLADIASPKLQTWLRSLDIIIPSEEIGLLKQIYYTLITGIRDFALLRFGFLFLLGYAFTKNLIYWIGSLLFQRQAADGFVRQQGGPSLLSGLTGGTIGSIMGSVHVLLVIAVLFIYVTLLPQAPFTPYIQASEIYEMGATQIIRPISGDLIADKLPVFTRAVEEEFSKILQRKYEVIDRRIPNHIAEAAKELTKDVNSEEEKARVLYEWVGTRIQYDGNKVKAYEERNEWKEQSPEDTFSERKGVCIDFSRLYAVMARSIELKVKVVTGLGYDGRGGYGPHAWNEVYLPEEKRWVPLDTTWAAGGKDWFNPPDFYETHVKDA